MIPLRLGIALGVIVSKIKKMLVMKMASTEYTLCELENFGENEMLFC
jgi:hypothetical protein